MARGCIITHTGPMFSGKTTALLEDVQRFDTVAAFVPATDDRYESGAITSHSGDSLAAAVLDPGDPGAMLDPIEDGVDAVVVDEAQFFADALVQVLARLRDAHSVLVAGLARDFRGEPFGPMPAVLSAADTVHHHTARCDTCGGPASRTQRLIDGEPAPRSAPTVDVAGTEKYEARCTEHHVVPD